MENGLKNDQEWLLEPRRMIKKNIFSKRSPWQGKTAVICGGSSGLGLSLAREMIRQRVGHLFLIARNSETLQEACAELHLLLGELEAVGSLHSTPPHAISLETIPMKITSLTANLADAVSIRQAVEQIRHSVPRVDLVIQAAGASDRGIIANLTRERLVQLVDANIVTSLHAVQSFTPLLKSSRGVMVMVGSLSSFFAPRYLGGYSIVKHGLAALAQQSRLELAQEGVHVMLCCPGPIRRPDAGLRYEDALRERQDVPESAKLPAGGAKVEGLCPDQLAKDLLHAAHRRKILLVRPRIVWWLRLVHLISPWLGERILQNRTS